MTLRFRLRELALLLSVELVNRDHLQLGPIYATIKARNAHDNFMKQRSAKRKRNCHSVGKG
jgi:hypothetical protein